MSLSLARIVGQLFVFRLGSSVMHPVCCGTNPTHVLIVRPSLKPMDGSDDLDSASRQAILDQDGEWSLWVLASGASATQVMKVVREEMGWSLHELAAAKKNLPGELVRGTRVEMKRFLEKVPLPLRCFFVCKPAEERG